MLLTSILYGEEAAEALDEVVVAFEEHLNALHDHLRRREIAHYTAKEKEKELSRG